MALYWQALPILRQVAGELGLVSPATVVGLNDVQSSQLLSLLNAAGNELQLYYPWEQFTGEWSFDTVPDQDEYDLPVDLAYFKDQTQWDRTNHWPLLGPKSPQEWAYLKGSLVAPLPRVRYRIAGNKFKIYPNLTSTSTPSTIHIAMEYVSKNWITTALGDMADMITLDSDVLMYNPWLLIKFVKLKFYELKGLSTTAVQADFMRIFTSLTGKDTGAEILSLSPRATPQLIGPWSIPDGSWQVV